MTRRNTADELRSDIARRLKETRKLQRYSQRDIANVLGITPQAVSLIERGSTTLSSIDIITLAKFLEVPVEYLLEGRKERGSSANQDAEEIRVPVLDFLPNTAYDDISEEGKAEMHKFLQYLRFAYPKR